MLQLLSDVYNADLLLEPSPVWGALCSKGKVWGGGGSGNSNYAVAYLLSGRANIITYFIYLTWKLSANCLRGWRLRRLKGKSDWQYHPDKCSRGPLRGHDTFTKVHSSLLLLREGFSEALRSLSGGRGEPGPPLPAGGRHWRPRPVPSRPPASLRRDSLTGTPSWGGAPARCGLRDVV